MKNGIRLILLIALFCCETSATRATEIILKAMRITFLQAEQYIKQGRDNDFLALASTLKSYPLYPYLQYQWLTKHMEDSKAIQSFLLDFPDTRYAGLLHRQWLAYLGQQQQWPAYIRHYKSTTDTELECYFAQAQYYGGQGGDAMEAAKRLWLNSQTQSAACNGLFALLKASTEFGPDLIWKRFHAALNANDTAQAAQLLPLFQKADADIAELWLKIQQHPQKIRQTAILKKAGSQSGPLASYAIRRWLKSDPLAALAEWNALKKHLKLAKDLAADTEKQLGLALAYRHDSRAYEKLAKYAGEDHNAQEWRIRAALIQQNWNNVLAGISALNQEHRNQDKWLYWQARALLATDKDEQGRAILDRISSHRSFYGFLAAEQLNKEINLAHNPIPTDENALAKLRDRSEFVAVKELLTIDRRPEASRQWRFAIADLDSAQLGIAAKLAHQWQWWSMAIVTAAKGNLWDDLDLRFPLQHQTLVETYASINQLDPALVFALIRQESAFDRFAGSSAGAIGLMQVMPKTAQQTAAELGQPWRNDFNLLDPEINIRYGSHYFKKMLNQLDGNVVLAAAAYNAGPNRIKQWRPHKLALPADIWIETIPYKETRAYVSSVLMYGMIYQKHLHRNSLKLTELLQKIPPG